LKSYIYVIKKDRSKVLHEVMLPKNLKQFYTDNYNINLTDNDDEFLIASLDDKI